MSKFTVDVIMPTYNNLPWIRQAVESVLTQTHKDLLLYIVDDGSTDETSNYVKSLKDKRVRYIVRETNSGKPDRNLGIQSSSSPFVAFLDADDFWYSQKLEKQMTLLKNHPNVGMVYGHVYVVDEDNIVQRTLRIWKKGNLVNDLSEGNIIAGSASMVLVRRKILEKAGLFKQNLVNGEDWELWLRIAKICDIDFVPEILAAIRSLSTSVQTNAVRMADGLIYTYGEMKRELNLTQSQQRKLASYCLYQSAQLYFSVGERVKARKTLFYLFKENPDALFNWENWLPHVEYGFFSRVIFGNKLFTIIGVCVKKLFHLLAWLIKLPFRVVRRFLRSAQS